MDKIHQPLLWTNFVIWEVKIVNILHDQMNEDDQSTLNPIRTVFPFAFAVWDGIVFMSFWKFHLQAYFCFLCYHLSYLQYIWVNDCIKKLHVAFLVILNLNIPFILFVTVIIIFVIVSGLIEGNLRSLRLNILNSFIGLNFFHKVFIKLFGVIWDCMKEN